MAEYYMPYEVHFDNGRMFIGLRRVVTYGKAPYPRQDPWVKIAKKKVSNEQWKQLEAVSKGRFVNHLGRGHSRSVLGSSVYLN